MIEMRGLCGVLAEGEIDVALQLWSAIARLIHAVNESNR